MSSGQPSSLSSNQSGCSDLLDSSLTLLRTDGNKSVPHRVVTVATSGPSSRSFATPVARKSCSSRPSISVDVGGNAAAQSSDKCSSESSNRKSVTRATQSPTPMPVSSSSNLQSTPRLTTDSIGQIVSRLRTTAESTASASRQKLPSAQSTHVREDGTQLLSPTKVGTDTAQDGNSKATPAVPTTSPKLCVASAVSMMPTGIHIKPDPDGPSETLPPLHVPTGEITPGPFSGHTKVVSCVQVLI